MVAKVNANIVMLSFMIVKGMAPATVKQALQEKTVGWNASLQGIITSWLP